MATGFLAGGGYAASSGSFENLAELPRSTPSTTVPTINGTTTTLTDTGNAVTNATNLQNAINSTAALDGSKNHQIILPAGAAFTVPTSGVTGNKMFTLPARSGTNASGTGWILITSNGALPSRGTRILTTDTAKLAQINLTAGSSPESCFVTLDSARHYWLAGLEICKVSASTWLTGALVQFGNGGKDQTGTQAHDLVIDRCYVHGISDGTTYFSGNTTSVVHGISLQGGSSVVVDCWISEIHSNSQDSQAIVGWNGTGPYLILNNHLEAPGENIMFGGSDPYTLNLTPSDITVQRNHCYKPPRWATSDLGYVSKNLFEIKSAARVLIENNVFENHWNSADAVFTHPASGQSKAINIKSNNQGDSTTNNGGPGSFSNNGQYWSTTADVTFRYNIIRNACGGMTIAGNVSAGNVAGRTMNTVGTFRLNIHDNLFYNIGNYQGSTSGQYLISNGDLNSGVSTIQGVFIANNTWHFNGVDSGNQFWNFPDPAGGTFGTGLVCRNNIVGALMQYGIKADASASGTTSLDGFWATSGGSYEFDGNLLVGTESAAYPANNTNVATTSGIWTNPSTGDFSLASLSPALASGIGGSYSGANISAVLAATSGVVI